MERQRLEEEGGGRGEEGGESLLGKAAMERLSSRKNREMPALPLMDH